MGIEVRNLYKRFPNTERPVINDVSFNVEKGEFISLTGRSGSGKSTLLYLISGLDEPSEGSVAYDGVTIESMTPHELHAFRNTRVGFVFQFHYLLPELTAIENVTMPLRKQHREIEGRIKAEELLDQFDLHGKHDRYPGQLSGGEQQRVAIARALITDPDYLFADEPTGNLDSINGQMVMEIFKQINKKRKMTIVMVTHERDYAKMAMRTIELFDGEVRKDQRKK